MQENKIEDSDYRLLDEALASEAIKNTFRLGWEFITLNQKFTLTAMVIFITLNILGMIPILALIFMVLSAVFGLSIQIHMGRTLYLSRNIKEYISEIENSNLETILNRYSATAFGAYLGWVVLLLIFLVIFGVASGGTGLINGNMSDAELINALLTLGVPFLLVALILSYVQPLVQANIVMANSFQDGFKAVFSIFSTNLWQKALQKSYFKYVTIFGTIIILLIFTFSFIIGMITTLTGLTMIGNILLIIIMYIFTIIMIAGSMMLKRLVDGPRY